MKKQTYLLKIVLTTLGLLMICTPLLAASKALLIGVGTYKNLPYVTSQGLKLDNLRGPSNDVKKMKEILMAQYSFRPGDIAALMDQEATREAILENFDQFLIKETKPGDLVLVYFSGHGTRIPDGTSGFFKALCPYDVQPKAGKLEDARLLTDGELANLLNKLKGRETVVIIDSCHSGGMTRSVRGVSTSPLEETPAVRSKFLPVEIAELGNTNLISRGIQRPDISSSGAGGNRIFLASSKEDQISLEMTLSSGVVHGAFTAALLEGLAKKKDLSYEELFGQAQKTIKDKFRLEQDPQLKANQKTLLAQRVFKAQSPVVSPKTTPSKDSPPSPVPASPPNSDIAKDNLKVLVRLDPLAGATPETLDKFRERLLEMPYVELVNTDRFDYLIRGEFKNNRYQIRLITPMGDQKVINPSKELGEIIKGMAPHLEYVKWLKQLSRISQPNPPFNVTIRMREKDRRDFRVGEKAQLLVFSDKDCYVILLNLDSQGGMQILFPNQYYSSNFIKAGQVIKIPDERMGKKFELEFSEPVGEEMVKVIAMEKPFRLEDLGLNRPEDPGKTQKLPKPEKPAGLNVAQLSFGPKGFMEIPEGTRGIMVKKVETISQGKSGWSEDTIIIRTHP
jgi:hypothetical protein